MGTVEYARNEFKFKDCFKFLDWDKLNNGIFTRKELENKLLELLEIFDNQRHSGNSAAYVLEHFSLILEYKAFKTGKRQRSGATLKDHALNQFKECEWLDAKDKPCDSSQERMMNDILDLVIPLDEAKYNEDQLKVFRNCFIRVADYKPLSPLTGEESEWKDLGDQLQNQRYFAVFWEKGEENAYDSAAIGFRHPNGGAYSSSGSHLPINFPYFPTTKRHMIKVNN